MKIRNLTPHPITINWVEYQPDGPAPRLSVSRLPLADIVDDFGFAHDGGEHAYDEHGMPHKVVAIPVVRSILGDPTGLPEPQDDTILVVSALVAEHPSLCHRNDLAYPGEAIRDSQGKVIGCSGLCAGPGLAKRLTYTLTGRRS